MNTTPCLPKASATGKQDQLYQALKEPAKQTPSF